MSSSGCGPNFSSLPQEIKLKILRYLDISTLLGILPDVNEEFKRVSSDCLLYQRYEAADYDHDGLVARSELSHELFRKNLKMLKITCEQLNNIADLEFTKLYLTVISIKKSVSKENLRDISRKSPNLVFRGRIPASIITRELLPQVKSTETVVISGF